MAGANISYSRDVGLYSQILNVLGYKMGGLRPSGKMCTKAGIPATDTAADAPVAKGDLCFDSTNSEVYICTVYTNSTTFTWVKIT